MAFMEISIFYYVPHARVLFIGTLQAKSNERQWCRHQTSGELDDTKLIEGLTGEKTIYRRRTEKEPEIGAPQLKPKRLKLVVDVSGSMYRFNGYDGRLDRELEACVMVMEAFSGYEGKFQYDIVGHSGDDYRIIFVDLTQPPTDNKRRLEVIKASRFVFAVFFSWKDKPCDLINEPLFVFADDARSLAILHVRR